MLTKDQAFDSCTALSVKQKQESVEKRSPSQKCFHDAYAYFGLLQSPQESEGAGGAVKGAAPHPVTSRVESGSEFEEHRPTFPPPDLQATPKGSPAHPGPWAAGAWTLRAKRKRALFPSCTEASSA